MLNCQNYKKAVFKPVFNLIYPLLHVNFTIFFSNRQLWHPENTSIKVILKPK